MQKQKLSKVGLLFVAIFAFSFGFAIVGSVHGGPDPCCTIDPTPHCSGGVGDWKESLQECVLDPLGACDDQQTPMCW